MTAGHREKSKNFLALLTHRYWRELRNFTTGHAVYSVQYRISNSGLCDPVSAASYFLKTLEACKPCFTVEFSLTPTGHGSISAVIDFLKRWRIFILTRRKATAADAFEHFAGPLIHYHGFLEIITSDGDDSCSQLELQRHPCARLCSDSVILSAYQPTAERQTEPVGRILECMYHTHI